MVITIGRQYGSGGAEVGKKLGKRLGLNHKPGFIKGLKAEFKKIVWPNQETVAKQSATVVVITILLGAVIAFLDYLIKNGLNIILLLGQG